MYGSFKGRRTKASDSDSDSDPTSTRGPWRLMVVPALLATGLLLAACGSSSSAAPSTSSTAVTHHGGGNGKGAGGGNASGGAAGLAKGVTVTVKGVSGDQLTVTTKVGRTKTVVVGSATTITQNGSTVSLSALKAGETILVKGTLSSSGDIAASSIAIQG